MSRKDLGLISIFHLIRGRDLSTICDLQEICIAYDTAKYTLIISKQDEGHLTGDHDSDLRGDPIFEQFELHRPEMCAIPGATEMRYEGKGLQERCTRLLYSGTWQEHKRVRVQVKTTVTE